MAQSPLERKARMLAQVWGLNAQERLSITETLLRVDCRSWKDLNDEQFARLCDGFEMAALLVHLKGMG